MTAQRPPTSPRSRERVARTLAHREPDRVPFDAVGCGLDPEPAGWGLVLQFNNMIATPRVLANVQAFFSAYRRGLASPPEMPERRTGRLRRPG